MGFFSYLVAEWLVSYNGWRKWSCSASGLIRSNHSQVQVYHFQSLASPLVVGTGHFTQLTPASLFGSSGRKELGSSVEARHPRSRDATPTLLGGSVSGKGLSSLSCSSPIMKGSAHSIDVKVGGRLAFEPRSV